MVDELAVGRRAEQTIEVTPEFAIDFTGNENARVLATPWLIGFLEMTCRNSVKPVLPPDQDTVGTEVQVKHLAATPIGMKVTFRSELIGINGPRLLFKVSATDDRERIAEGTHERFIVNIERFAERVSAKKTR